MAKLSATSATVLLLANKDCYRSAAAIDYLQLLDLHEGQGMHDECLALCDFYGEIINNRKFAIAAFVRQCLENTTQTQVIIAGAGLDPLGVEIAQNFPNAKIFELDQENMASKARLLPHSPNAFIDTNLMDTSQTVQRLQAHGWQREIPSLLILEGISYYLATTAMQNLVTAIAPKYAIVEYLKHDRDINADFVHIPRQIFALISHCTDCPPIVRYDTNEITDLLAMQLLDKYDMHKAQQQRTGKNQFFASTDCGWIEVCLLVKSYLAT